MVGGDHPEYLFGEGLAVDEDEWVLVVDDFDLCLPGERSGGDEGADPAAAEAGDDASDLVGADRRGRVDAFGLAEDDERGVVGGGADVEPADEVDAAVAAGSGQPAFVVAAPEPPRI